jgi:hypothetical protein
MFQKDRFLMSSFLDDPYLGTYSLRGSRDAELKMRVAMETMWICANDIIK